MLVVCLCTNLSPGPRLGPRLSATWLPVSLLPTFSTPPHFYFAVYRYLCISQFHLRPAPPPGYCGAFARLVSPGGWGICKFCTARGPGICQPPGHSRAFDTHAVSYQNITTQKVLLEKKQIGSSVKDRNKLLIKPELHSEIGAIDVNQRFLVIESNFCWYYLKNILSHL